MVIIIIQRKRLYLLLYTNKYTLKVYLRVSVVVIGSDGTIKGIVMSNYHDGVCNDGRLRNNPDYTLFVYRGYLRGKTRRLSATTAQLI
jgi:hypothetical protein